MISTAQSSAPATSERQPPAGLRDRNTRLTGRVAAHAAVIGVVLAAAVAATWPLAASISTAAPLNLIDSMEAAWIFGWIAHALANEPWNLFNGNIFHPADLSLAFAENLIGVAVFVAPIYWITDNPILTTNIAYLLLLTTSGYGTALLVRELTGEWMPAAIAGAAVAAAPYQVFNLPHTHVVATHLIPWILLVLVRVARDGPTPGRSAALVLLVSLQFWSSLTGGMIAAVGAGAWGAVLFLRSSDRRRVLAHAVVAGAAVIILIAPVGLIYRQVQRNHPEYQRPAEEVLVYAAEPRSYLAPATGGGLFHTTWNEMRNTFGDYASAPWEKWLFPGLWLSIAGTAGVAAGVARALARKPPPWWPSTVLAAALVGVTAFVMTLGPRWGLKPTGFPLPFVLVNGVIPGVGMRVPGRYAVLVILALAILGAAAISAARGRLRTVLLIASVAVLAAETLPARYPIAPVPRLTDAHRSVAAADGAVLHLPTLEFDANGSVTGGSLIREPLQLYFSTAHFRPVVNGYAAFVPTRTAETLRAVHDFPSPGAFDALESVGVTTVVVQTTMLEGTPWAGVVERLGSTPGVALEETDRGVRVYDISNAR